VSAIVSMIEVGLTPALSASSLKNYSRFARNCQRQYCCKIVFSLCEKLPEAI